MTDNLYAPEQKGAKLKPDEMVGFWIENGLLDPRDQYIYPGDDYICPYCNPWNKIHCNGGAVETGDGWVIVCQCRIRYYFSEQAKLWKSNSHGMPSAYSTWRMPDWTREAREPGQQLTLKPVYQWLDNPTSSLVLTGAPGTGKTSLAVAMRNTLADRGIPSMWLIVEKLTSEITATWRKRDSAWYEKRELIQRAPVLFLDDMGKTGLESTAGIKGEFFGIINERYNSRRPTIVTSNLDLENLVKLTDAVIDRLLDRQDGTLSSRFLGFNWPSFRTAGSAY